MERLGPRLDWKKVLWFGGHGLVALIFAVPLFSWGALAVFAGLAMVTLCLGHSVGSHRLMIHRSFVTPLWLERVLVYLGTLIGMAGPLQLVRLHHERDFLQHEPECHDYFCHRSGIVRDFLYNFFYRFELPAGALPTVSNAAFADPVVRFLDATWRLQQLPLAVGLYLLGGWSFVVWGVSVRIFVGVFGHWYVGYRCHNDGERPHWVADAGVQGSNHRWLGIASFGEGFHNNHHAFPDSARMGLEPGEFDLGWWCVRGLERFGLAHKVKRADSEHYRPEPRIRHSTPVADVVRKKCSHG
ncbi:MAG: acyl-CoA desaturase [Myxococcota bacterium]